MSFNVSHCELAVAVERPKSTVADLLSEAVDGATGE